MHLILLALATSEIVEFKSIQALVLIRCETAVLDGRLTGKHRICLLFLLVLSITDLERVVTRLGISVETEGILLIILRWRQ